MQSNQIRLHTPGAALLVMFILQPFEHHNGGGWPFKFSTTIMHEVEPG